MKLKEITVFADGDSSKVNTWSNVPYFFTQELIARGIKINRVNIGPHIGLNLFFERRLFKIWKVFSKDTVFHFERTSLHYWLTQRKIKRATRDFPLTDAWLFMNFSYYNKYSDKPSLLFCDWTLEYLIRDRLGRKPDLLERGYIKKQNKAIDKAYIVISLFPKIASLMQIAHPRANISHLDTNVVNSFYKGKLKESEILSFKARSAILLFIGDIKYIEGARLLLAAYRILKNDLQQITLHIIGLESSDFDDIPHGVTCHGYLDKEVESDCKIYYDLIMNAKVFINPTPLWGGYSSTVEAMYFYNPIVIAPYEEFTYTFGESPSFAAFAKEFEADDLALNIKKILHSPNYTQLCIDAHYAVRDYTWTKYVDKFLAKIS
jgi:glycosyltransferase involved in cell wall biosynthesis